MNTKKISILVFIALCLLFFIMPFFLGKPSGLWHNIALICVIIGLFFLITWADILAKRLEHEMETDKPKVPRNYRLIAKVVVSLMLAFGIVVMLLELIKNAPSEMSKWLWIFINSIFFLITAWLIYLVSKKR